MSGSPSRARRAISPTRPHRPQIRRGRGEQAKHRAPPPLSLATTTRTRSQPLHASASWWARQRLQSPAVPTRVSRRPVRPQTLQVGTGSAAPLSRSSVTRRATTGGAPPSSTSGPFSVAAASSRPAAGLVITAATAAATASGDSPGHAAIATPTTASTRQRGQDLDAFRAPMSCPSEQRRTPAVTASREGSSPGGVAARSPASSASRGHHLACFASHAPSRSVRPGRRRRCRTGQPAS